MNSESRCGPFPLILARPALYQSGTSGSASYATSAARSALSQWTDLTGRAIYCSASQTGYEVKMNRVLRALLLIVLVGMLLVGRCLPCPELDARAAAMSCCDQSDACIDDPAPNSKAAPCPFQKYVVASTKTDPQLQKVQFVPHLHLSFHPVLVVHEIPSIIASTEVPSHHYTPAPLYVLHERFLI